MWSVSLNEENYHGQYETVEEAIAAGKSETEETFWIGQCVPPVQPEELFDESIIDDWIEFEVYDHDDYAGEWAEGAVDTTREQREELASEIKPLIAAWLDRHGLRPTFFNIDHQSVRKIEDNGASSRV